MLQEFVAGGEAQNCRSLLTRLAALIGDLDHRVAAAVFAPERVAGRRVWGGQREAARGGGAPEIPRLVGPVDRIAAVEEDRMRHWRAAIDGGAVPHRERLRPESADRRVIAAPSGRDRPGIARAAVH